jgi:hypothetical protein
MTRAKSAVVILVAVWAIEAVTVLPVMWIGGASWPALCGALIFAGIVAAAVVATPIMLAEGHRRRDRRAVGRAGDP